MEMEQMEKLLRTVIAEELKPIQSDVNEIKQTIGEMKDQLDMLANEKTDTLAMLKNINGKLDSIRKHIEFTYIKTSMNELEINRLKM
jgi:uncharacterized FlaG/YvyC family protein